MADCPTIILGAESSVSIPIVLMAISSQRNSSMHSEKQDTPRGLSGSMVLLYGFFMYTNKDFSRPHAVNSGSTPAQLVFLRDISRPIWSCCSDTNALFDTLYTRTDTISPASFFCVPSSNLCHSALV